MTVDEFGECVGQLRGAIVQAMELFFSKRGMAFEAGEFLKETSIDLDQLAVEAHFYGVGVFPDVEDTGADKQAAA